MASFSNYTISEECRPAAVALLLHPNSGEQIKLFHLLYFELFNRLDITKQLKKGLNNTCTVQCEHKKRGTS